MPINNDLPDIKLPVKLKTGENPETLFYEQLAKIKVTLVAAPTISELLSYIPEFGTATWRDDPDYEFMEADRKAVVHDLFDGKILPTALETIGLVFKIEGMDIIDTTHLIRHRAFSFSAQCSADRDLRHDPAVVKPGIMVNDKFYSRYKTITRAAKQLYADMVDSGDVSILDARTILPRNLATFYFARGCIKDIMAYIRQRLDEQIQPTSDNVIAMSMLLELVRHYPMLVRKFEVGGPDPWYIKTVPTGRGSNIYMPKLKNDTFEYKPSWFLYQKRREDFPGNEVYEEIKREIVAKLKNIEEAYYG
jgi:hypothetical protein